MKENTLYTLLLTAMRIADKADIFAQTTQRVLYSGKELITGLTSLNTLNFLPK